MRARLITATAIVLAMLCAAFGAVSWNASAAQGSQDSYGYAYTDSKAPAPSVSFNWIDITATGTYPSLSGDDTWGGPYPIGFSFPFYGNSYSMLNISTNCFVNFAPGSSSLSNDPIPDSSTPNNYVAPYWDDMVVDSNELVYETIGAEPNRQFVLEFLNVSRWASSYQMTFEIILNETGDIWFQYLTLNGMTGSSATVGIENSDGSVGTQYSYNSATLADNLAIRFSQGPVSIGASQSYLGMPGEMVYYNLTVTNRQPISDSFAITYTSVEGWPVALYDSLMNPLTDTDGDLIPDTDTVLPYSTVDIVVSVNIPMSPVNPIETTIVNASSYALPSNYGTCTLTTEMVGAWFTPPHSDYGDDTDSDGDFNYLVVQASVNVHVEGWYYLEGYAETSGGWYIGSAYAYPYLSAGSHSVDLYFYAWYIREMGMDGPYYVDLYLYDDSWTMIDQDLHVTDAYSVSDFMEVPGEIMSISDTGVDTDGNGLFDFLAVDVMLDVNYATDFRVYGDLYDPSGWPWLTSDTNTSSLSVGTRTVRLLFNAWDISESATVSGQFFVSIYLYVYFDGSWIYLSGVGLTTSYYDLSEFETPDARFEQPHGDYVTDGDLDGLYDYLVIEVGVNVSVEGDYTVTGILRADTWAGIIDIKTNTTHLSIGSHVVELWYPGWPIRYNSDSDDMDIELELRQGGTLLDTDEYTTGTYYYYYDFEDAPGGFEPPYAEIPLDLNGDLLYDYLVIEVPVNVTVAGTYEVYGYLSYIWTITEDNNVTYLPVGVTVVELRFVGWVIRNSGWDGPYDIDIYLYDSGARQMDYDWFSTSAYSYTDFQTAPGYLGWPHESYVEDTDMDGDLDGVFVNVSVVVDVAGMFEVLGYLYDSGWSWIANSGTLASLDVGTQTVQLQFSPWLIQAHGVDGSYRVVIELYDGDDNYLDSDSFSTAFYYYDDFDSTPPRIDSGWTDAAPAIDGAFSVDEWADAASVELIVADPMNGVAVTLLVMNDASNLYICYDAYGDTIIDESDMSSIAFDTDNDGIATDGAEDEFWISGSSFSSQGHLVYNDGSSWWTTHCSPFDDEGLEGAVGFGSSPSHASEHRIYEYAIPLSLLGASAGDLIGFLGGSHQYSGIVEAYDWEESWWPTSIGGAVDMDLYGEILLAELVIIPPPTTTAAIAGTAGSGGWYVSGVNVTLSATGGDGGVDYTEYRLNGGSWQTYSTPAMLNTDGTHILEFRSVDNAAQVEPTKSVVVNIDRAAPVTTSEVSGQSVWLNATDATSGLATTMYRVDGGAWQAYSAVLTISDEGTHTLEYYSVDVAGNVEATHSLEVEVEEDQGGGGLGFGDWTLWIVLAIIAIIAVISIWAIFGMRRRARESESRYAMRDMPSPVMQMQDDFTPPPQTQEPPKPPEGK